MKKKYSLEIHNRKKIKFCWFNFHFVNEVWMLIKEFVHMDNIRRESFMCCRISFEIKRHFLLPFWENGFLGGWWRVLCMYGLGGWLLLVYGLIDSLWPKDLNQERLFLGTGPGPCREVWKSKFHTFLI